MYFRIFRILYILLFYLYYVLIYGDDRYGGGVHACRPRGKVTNFRPYKWGRNFCFREVDYARHFYGNDYF